MLGVNDHAHLASLQEATRCFDATVAGASRTTPPPVFSETLTGGVHVYQLVYQGAGDWRMKSNDFCVAASELAPSSVFLEQPGKGGAEEETKSYQHGTDVFSDNKHSNGLIIAKDRRTITVDSDASSGRGGMIALGEASILDGIAYWELGVSAAHMVRIGVCKHDIQLGAVDAHPSSDAFFIENNGDAYMGGNKTQHMRGFVAGDVIGVMFDATRGTLDFFRNSLWIGPQHELSKPDSDRPEYRLMVALKHADDSISLVHPAPTPPLQRQWKLDDQLDKSKAGPTAVVPSPYQFANSDERGMVGRPFSCPWSSTCCLVPYCFAGWLYHGHPCCVVRNLLLVFPCRSCWRAVLRRDDKTRADTGRAS